jgi:hypothetical protein
VDEFQNTNTSAFALSTKPLALWPKMRAAVELDKPHARGFIALANACSAHAAWLMPADAAAWLTAPAASSPTTTIGEAHDQFTIHHVCLSRRGVHRRAAFRCGLRRRGRPRAAGGHARIARGRPRAISRVTGI